MKSVVKITKNSKENVIDLEAVSILIQNAGHRKQLIVAKIVEAVLINGGTHSVPPVHCVRGTWNAVDMNGV